MKSKPTVIEKNKQKSREEFNKHFAIRGEKVVKFDVDGLWEWIDKALTQTRKVPMGVSQWRAHGKKYGYCKYFENQTRKEVLGSCKPYMSRLTEMTKTGWDAYKRACAKGDALYEKEFGNKGSVEEKIKKICTYHGEEGTSGYLLSNEQFEEIFKLIHQNE